MRQRHTCDHPAFRVARAEHRASHVAVERQRAVLPVELRLCASAPQGQDAAARHRAVVREAEAAEQPVAAEAHAHSVVVGLPRVQSLHAARNHRPADGVLRPEARHRAPVAEPRVVPAATVMAPPGACLCRPYPPPLSCHRKSSAKPQPMSRLTWRPATRPSNLGARGALTRSSTCSTTRRCGRTGRRGLSAAGRGW